MSQGTKFIRAVVDANDWKTFRRASARLFTEQETPLFEYVRDYHTNYGTLPTAQILTVEAGFTLPTIGARGNTAFWFDSLRQRYAHTKVREHWPMLIDSVGMGASGTLDIAATISTLREMLASASFGDTGQLVTMGDMAEAVREKIAYARNHPGLIGISTGWTSLDEATQGMMGGDLVVIAGRPSMGKSYLMMEMALASHRLGKVIALTSMEMGLDQLTFRWLGRLTGINPTLIRKGELDTYQYQQVRDALDEIENPLSDIHLIAGNMTKSVEAIEAMIIETGPEIVFIDSAYLLSPSGKAKGYVAKWESISEVVRELKQMALRYDVPIVITVQFNRNQKSTSTKELDMGDIAGSDSIPQDASIVLGARKGPKPYMETQRIIEVMKNREGDCPTFATAFSFAPVTMEEVAYSPSTTNDGEPTPELTAWMG